MDWRSSGLHLESFQSYITDLTLDGIDESRCWADCHRFSDTAVARVSDDFYPRDPASSSPHLAACSYNSLLMGVLIQPDWDMFHRSVPAAYKHLQTYGQICPVPVQNADCWGINKLQ